jgi:uncharacterized protein (DUF736 family)
MSYDNNNKGALFKNKDRQSENHPLYKGNITIDGVEYWLSSWLKKSKAGETFMSLSVQPKKPKETPPPRAFDQDLESPEDLPF